MRWKIDNETGGAELAITNLISNKRPKISISNKRPEIIEN